MGEQAIGIAGQISHEVVTHWGLFGVLIVGIVAFLGSAAMIGYSSLQFIRRMDIVSAHLSVIISNQAIQHASCLNHYQAATQLTEDMRRLAHELSTIAARIQDYHMETYQALLAAIQNRKT